MVGAAFCGKLRDLDHYLQPAESSEDRQQNNAALLGFLLKMKRKGVPMTIERVTRVA